MKKTNKEMFAMLLGVIESANCITETDRIELTDFINGKIGQLEKKANTVSKADREKAELNARIADEIVKGLTACDKPVKVSDLIKSVDTLNGYSTQKLTPILTSLVKNGRVVKSTYKRETLYSVEAATAD
jgi:hypothetical protein